MGITKVEEAAQTIPEEQSVKIKVRSIMGTEIPYVDYEPDSREPIYAFMGSKQSLDMARESFLKVKDLTIRLSMIENAAYRLAMNIKKTQKRANALKNITIPQTETIIKTISDALEEKEREDFIRLKVIKREMNKKNEKS